MAYGALACSMLLVGSYVGLSRWLVTLLPVFVLGGLRFAIAAVCLLPWLRRQQHEAPLTRAEHLRLFAAGLIGNVLFTVCMLEGVARSSAVAAGVVMATLPAAVALLARLWLGEALGRHMLLGMACAISGVAVVSLQTSNVGSPSVPGTAGTLLLLAAVGCEACYVVLGRALARTVSPARITAGVNLWGLLLMAPCALWQAREAAFDALSVCDWAALLFYALAASVVSVWLWMVGARRVPAARAGIYTVFLPVGSTLVGLGLGEPLGAPKAAALALALLGVVLATR